MAGMNVQTRSRQECEENMQIEFLTAQNLRNPLGLENVLPRLSYRLSSDRRGDRQTARQILAASRPEWLEEGRADLWDSGRVADEKNYAIPWQGKKLASRQSVYWKVRVWDAWGADSAWSETARFEMGLLEEKDWRAVWIGRGDDWQGDEADADKSETDKSEADKSAAPALRGQFTLKEMETVEKARLYISGLGLFTASVNGQPVSDALFEPGESEYASRIYYAVYDIRPFLREGKNVVGVVLGNGQYASFAVDPVMKDASGRLSEKHRYQKDDTIYLRDGICGDVKLLAQVEITREDGSVELAAATDETWEIGESAVTFQNWYGGEDYDGQKAERMKGWDTPDGQEPGWRRAGWKQAVPMDPPKGRLCAREFPPVRIWESWKAVSVSPLPNGRWLVDMGKNSAGFVRLRLKGTEGCAGQKVELYPAEVLKPDGSGVDQASVTQSCDSLFSCQVKDSYVIAGTGEESWHPVFCYHGFQYVEVTGFPGVPTVDNFEGCAVRLMNEKFSDFETDQEILNRISRITDRSIESNMMFSFTDCPQIEKLGWLETTHLMFSSMAAGYDIRGWIPKIMLDMKDAQVTEEMLGEPPMERDGKKYPGFPFDRFANRETEGVGFVPGIAPGYFRIGGLYKDPNWGGACVMTPWYYYTEYGDEAILRENYGMMKAYVEHLDGQAVDGVLKGYAHMGEWGQLNENTPTTLVATCSFYLLAHTLSKIGRVLGQEEDAQRYAAMAERIRDGFYRDNECCSVDNEYCSGDKRYRSSDNKCGFGDCGCEVQGGFRKKKKFGNGSQASYGCVLFSGIVKPKDRQAALQGLLDAVAVKGDHLTSGEVGLKQVFHALAVNGHNDTVYRMVMNPTQPSYRHHVDQGLTTLPEYWNYTELWNGLGRSRNHAMMGHVKEWLCRHVLGIKPQAPGYERVCIRPWLGGGIHHVKGSVFTVRGLVKVECDRRENSISMCAQIPVGALAEVWIPCGEGQACYEVRGSEREEIEGQREEGYLKLSDVPSGGYCWEVKCKTPLQATGNQTYGAAEQQGI